MFIGVDKIQSELSADYTVLTKCFQFQGAEYSYCTKSSGLVNITVKQVIGRYIPWDIKVPKRGIFGDASLYLQANLNTDKQFEFKFKFSLFRMLDSYEALANEVFSIVSIAREIRSPKLYHRLLKLECRLTHLIMLKGEEIGYLFKIDDDEYSASKPFPFCLMKESKNIPELLPLLIAFSENYNLGRHSTGGDGYMA